MRTSYIAVISLLAWGLSSTAQAQTAPASCDRPHASGVTQEQLVSGARPREYRLFVPPAYDGRTPLPLVLDLHGSGGTAAGQAKTSGLDADVPRTCRRTEPVRGSDNGPRCGGIDDLGHTWPRDAADATALMWEFFRTHRLEP